MVSHTDFHIYIKPQDRFSLLYSGVGSVAAVAAMAATLFGKKKAKKKSEMIADAERRRTRMHNSGNHTYSKLRTDYACTLVSARFYFSGLF